MKSDPYLFNISNLAEAFGFGRDTVRKRLKAVNVQPAGRDGNADLYLLSDVGPALFGVSGSTADTADPNRLKPMDRKAWYQSENERLKFEVETGQLVPVDDVRKQMANLAKPMIAELEILPDILERDCGLLPDAVRMVQDKVDDLRNSIAEAVSKL